MKKNLRNGLIILIFAIIFASSSQSNLDYTKIQLNNNRINMIPLASDDIDGSRVFIDKDSVNRGIENITITYNNTDTGGSGEFFTNHTFKVNLTFSDDSQKNITLIQEGSSNNWTVDYCPNIFNITGETLITILAVNNDTGDIDNAPVIYDKIFTITNNLPSFGIIMNTTEVYRNETILIDFIPSDIEDTVMNLTWEVKLYDPDDVFNETLVVLGEKIFSKELNISTSYALGDWYVNATCWDSEGNSSTVKKYFTVKNNEPIIENILFKIEDGDLLDAESIDILEILRGPDRNLTVYVNATDVEANEMKLTISADDPVTGNNLLPAKYVDIPIAVNKTSNFTTDVSFPFTSGLGITELKIIILEDEIIQDEYIQEIIILNNAPTLHNFTINDEFGNITTIKEGDWLHFKFSAEDDEDTIEYVQISILYYDDQGGLAYINYSSPYTGSDTKIIVRAVDLKLTSGVYTVYAYIYDEDGDFATCSPQSFRIEIEPQIAAISWLLLIVGVIIGVTFGFVGFYTYYRKKLADITSGTIKETEKKTKKQSKKKHITETDKKIKEEVIVDKDSDEEKESKSKKQSKKKKLIRKL